MKTITKLNVFITLLVLLSSCIEKEGYYGESGNTIIENLTEKEWNRKYHSKLDNGTEIDMDETYIFKKNGQGTYKEIATYKNGKVENRTSYFHWSFTTPNFKYIYLDLDCFWEIQELTPTKLHIYETWEDPITVPNQTYRDYQEYHYNNQEARTFIPAS
ncbi:4-hydroxy-3-methylbut-2-enyl diphosphate reductase [Phocaeicola plebeius]|uniref:4-hydroxy-3-methylbut-2-enyl diphosphate reductase n=1 Tax=Phocaeicola plebeius TaxID=310297 RepID=UPI003565C267